MLRDKEDFISNLVETILSLGALDESQMRLDITRKICSTKFDLLGIVKDLKDNWELTNKEDIGLQ